MSRASSGFIAPNITAPSNASPPNVWAKRVQSSPLLANTTTSTSNTHANTSANAAAVSDSRPMVVCVNCRSFKMRAITGNAVTDIADAKNNANGQNTALGGDSGTYK